MGHWYDEGGNPRHFEGKNGNGTTLREARKLSLYPSVTTIGNVKAKFALTNWLQEEAAMMAATDIRLRMMACPEGWDEIENNRDWAKIIVKASREKTMEKADEGTDIHDILEKFQIDPYCKEAIDNQALCDAVAHCIMENTGFGIHGNFTPESRFCDAEHGYAGMCDLHNEHWIIDFKTKDTVSAKTRGWKEQAEQLAAYANGLGYPNARLANIFISREDPTQVKWFEHKDDMAWERFRHTLMLWQVENKFGPYFDSLTERKKAA